MDQLIKEKPFPEAKPESYKLHIIGNPQIKLHLSLSQNTEKERDGWSLYLKAKVGE